MNQSASAARRPAGSTATAGCCPMLVHQQFYVDSFSAQAPLGPPPPPPSSAQQCLSGAQTNQLQLNTSQSNVTQPPQPSHQATNRNNSGNHSNLSSVSDGMAHSVNLASNQQQQSNGQQVSSRQDHSNYNTSILAHDLQLHNLITSRFNNSNSCIALAAALATLHHQQQLLIQQAHQQQLHHQAPINHTQQSTNAANNAVPPTNTTNQVPTLNLNSYNAAQPYLNIPAPAPVAAHLNLSNNHHHQPTNVSSNNNSTSVSHANNANQLSHHQTSHRPLATNTTLNSVANQQANYRTAPHPPPPPPPQLIQQQSAPIHAQGQTSRPFSDDHLTNILNASHAMLLNSLFANHAFAPFVAPINSARHISPPPSGQPQAPVAMPPVQQQAAVNAAQYQQPQQPSESLTDQAQQQPPTIQPVSQNTAPIRTAQAPQLDAYSLTAASQQQVGNIFQLQRQHTGSVNHHINNNQPQQESVPLQTQQPHQQQQPQQLPQVPMYTLQQLEQAATLFPQITQQFLQQLAASMGLRAEPYSHHHHHPPHHYHHNYGSHHHHHHHHHGANGQSNGQDDTMLTISESKPRGLTRAEIDSLTPYLQMNEKDSRTCVICLSRFELKSKIRPLPCEHAFHAKCVDKWLRANRTCPICRRDALKTYGSKIKRI